MHSTQPTAGTLTRLRRQLNSAGIPHKRVAEVAGVSKFMVSHVLAGRAKSARVITVMRGLIAEAKPRRESEREPAA